MPHFNLGTGGLDINLLAPIWAEARTVPVVGPLAGHLLQRLNTDPGNLFRRIGLMRAARPDKGDRPEAQSGADRQP
jgi:hypothetical protein